MATLLDESGATILDEASTDVLDELGSAVGFTLPPAHPPFIRMTNPVNGEEAYVTIDAYEQVWWALGWRSDDDPTFVGPTPPLQEDSWVEDFDQRLLFQEGKVVTISNVNGLLTLDYLDGSVFNLTLQGDSSLTAVDNVPADRAVVIVVHLRQDGTGGWTWDWPASVKWANKLPPTLGTTANIWHRFQLETIDGGTTWAGDLVGEDYG